MSLIDDFNEFWYYYPRRIGKLAARVAYIKARKVATAEAILAGVENFVRHMPREARFRPHAKTWLNQGRWEDDYEAPRQPPVPDWFEECRQIHGGACGLSQYVHRTRKIIEEGRQQP